MEIVPIVASVRSAKLNGVVKMEQIVTSTGHLRRVLSPRWFDELRAIVLTWDPDLSTTFELQTHMGYYTDVACLCG